MFEHVEDYLPYIEAGLNPSASYAAPQSFNNGTGVSIEQGKLLLKLGFRRVTQRGTGSTQKWWVGPLLLKMGIWELAPWPHAPVEDQQLPTT